MNVMHYTDAESGQSKMNASRTTPADTFAGTPDRSDVPPCGALTLRTRLIFAAVATVGLLLAVESAGQVYDRVRSGEWFPFARPQAADRMYQPYIYTQTMLRPGFQEDILMPTGKAVPTHINSLGFRGPEIPPQKPTGGLRIACIGGSAVFLVGDGDDSTTWPGQLEKRLAARSGGRPVEVINAGTPGYNSAETLSMVVHRLSTLEPDVVVIYQLWNDLKPNRAPGFRPDYTHWRTAPVTASRLSAAINHSSILARMRTLARESRTWEESTQRFDIVSEEGIQAFTRNLRLIAAAVQEWGGHIVLCTFPTALTADLSESRRTELWQQIRQEQPYLSLQGVLDGQRRFNQAIRSLAEKKGFILADVEPAVSGVEAFFYDPVHLTSAGAAKVAETVDRALGDLTRF
jgi:lysophospholipase L1-like esterase